MKILIIGFQRSGTTLLRRIFQVHPDVQKMFHEKFLLKICSDKKTLENFLINFDIDPIRDNWGEKVPFYPGARKIPAIKYCEMWKEYFGKQAKIIHIVRHPIDVANSITEKYGTNFNRGLTIYKNIMPAVVPNLLKDPSVLSIKYESLLLNPEAYVQKMYKFCGLRKSNFKKRLEKLANNRYKKIDPTRAFAFREKKIPKKLNLQNIFDVLNEISGPEYKL